MPDDLGADFHEPVAQRGQRQASEVIQFPRNSSFGRRSKSTRRAPSWIQLRPIEVTLGFFDSGQRSGTA